MQVAHTLRRATLLWGKDTAVLDGETTLTYVEMGERVERMAQESYERVMRISAAEDSW